MFMEHGDYVNRAKARTRYLPDTLGVDGLVQDYQDKVEKALRGENLMVHIEEPVLKKTGDKTLSDRRVIAQKQQGLYAVYYHPLGGCLAPQKLRQIYETIKDMEDVELRITPQQGVYIINCTADEAKAVLAITEDGARNRFEESDSCIGAVSYTHLDVYKRQDNRYGGWLLYHQSLPFLGKLESHRHPLATNLI